jgi:WxcM-like, C-terminal
MPKLIELTTHENEKGKLTVFEKVIGADIKRVFYIHDVDGDEVRGNHGLKTTTNVLICLAGSCRIRVKNKESEQVFYLAQRDKCLILEPGDWHQMDNFTADAILLVISDSYYDEADYFFEMP